MVEPVIERAKYRRQQREEALAELWEAAQQVVDFNSARAEQRLKNAVETIRTKISGKRHRTNINPHSPWMR